MPGFFPPISLLNISVYRLQPRLFIDSLPYLKKKKKKSYGSAARLDQAIVSEVHFLVHKMLDFRSFRPLDPLQPSA
jgi:hypothetical protein